MSQEMRPSGTADTPEPRRVLLRLSMLVVTAAALTGWSVFAGSRSASPSILGRYSPGLFAFVTLYGLLTASLAAAVLVWSARIRRAMHTLVSRAAASGVLLESWAYGFPVLVTLFLWLGSRITPLAGERYIALSLLLGYAGILTALLASSPKARRRKASSRGWLLLFSTLFTAVLIEIAIRLLMPGSIFDPSLDLRPHIRLRLQNADLPGVDSAGWYTTNKWGMRGEEPPQDWDEWLTIVCIGGSTTQCFELDDSRTWPWLLQENIREDGHSIWVGNGGLAGHSTRAHLIFMSEVISEIRPDLVVFLIGINEKVNYDLGERRELAAIGVTRTSFGYRLFCASRLVQVLYSIKKAVLDEVPVQNTPWASRLEIVPMPGPEMELPDDLHDLLIDPGFTRNNVRRLIEMAREYGVTPVFLTQPMLYDDSPYWRTVLGHESSSDLHPGLVSAATWWRLLDTVNADVMSVCAEEGAACYDLASAIPHSPDYFFDDIHFSEAGAAMVADSVAAFLRDSVLTDTGTGRQTE